jgi:PAS domain S-box-containing protein
MTHLTEPAEKDRVQLLQRIAILEAQLSLQTKDRNLTQRLLDQRSGLYRTLFDTMTQGVVYQAADGTIIEMNPAAERILGKTREDFLGETSVSVEHDTLDEHGQPFPGLEHPSMVAFRTGKPSSNVLMQVYNPQQQRYRWIVIGAVPLFRSGETQPYEVYTVFDDITERKEAELRQAESDKRYRQLVEGMPGIAYNFSNTRGGIYYSPGVVDILGYTPDFLYANPMVWHDSIHPDDLRLVDQAIDYFTTGIPFRLEYRVKNAQGEWRWLEDRSIGRQVLADEIIISGLVMDITARKQTEQTLRESEARFRLHFENSMDAYLLAPPNGQIVYANQAAADMFGCSLPEMLQLSRRDIMDESDPRLEPASQERVEKGFFHGELTCIRRDGTKFPVELTTSIGYDLYGQPQGSFHIRDISERKRAELALRESQERFRMLVENLDAEFWITSVSDRRPIYISPAVEGMWGVAMDELYNPKAFMSFVLPEDQPAMLESLQKQDQGEKTSIEYRIRRPDGSLCWLWDRTFPIYDEDGRVTRTGGVTSDITSLKQIQQQLEELNQDLEQRVSVGTAEVRDLYEHAPIGYHSLDSNGVYVLVNQTELDWLGYSREEMIGRMRVIDLFTPHSREIFSQQFPLFKQTGSLKNIEFEMVRKDGSHLNVLVSATAIYDASGNYLMSRTTMADISTLTRTREALRISEQTYRALFENSNDAIFLMTPDGTELDANTKALGMLGFTREEYKQLGKAAIIKKSEDPVALKKYEALLRGESVPLYESTLVSRNGREVQVEINLSAVRDEDGSLRLVQSVARDITERKQAEAELQAQRDFARLVMESLGQALVVSDTEGRVEYANPFLARLLDSTQEELVGQTLERFIFHEDSESLEQNFTALLMEQKGQYEFRLRLNDGSVRNMLITATPRRQAGRVVGVIASFTDITAEKETEANLRKSRDQLSQANVALERAARMKDEFLASMSHELRTPLTGILGLSEVLQLGTYGPVSEKQGQIIKNIENSGRHLLELINDILDLSKIGAGKLELNMASISVDEVCQASLKLVKGMASQKQLVVNFSTSPPGLVVQADPRRLKQMLVNLLSNAIKFTPEHGRLGLEVQAQPELEMVNLTVWDNGIGIAPDDLPRLFQPFVQLDSSLARQFSGTGLGLSLVSRMAELHGGTVSVQSQPGSGSRFTLQLPWQPPVENEDREATQIRDTDARRGVRRALILEDDITAAGRLTRCLGALGIPARVLENTIGLVENAVLERPGILLLGGQFAMQASIELLADDRTRHIPVALVGTDISAGLPAGVLGHLEKPVSIAALRSLLELALASNRPRQPAARGCEAGVVPSVLVTDDNEITRNLLVDFLQAQGYYPLSAASGEEALQMARVHHPDLILMDIQMPDMDGLEAIQHIRADADIHLNRVPIIAVTALAMPGDRERCLQAGANDYISKPISMLKLLENMEQFLK